MKRMRLLRLGVWTLLACLLALAGTSAYAAEQKQAVFKVTLTATLTKEWTYTHVEESETGCVRTTRGSGRWQAKLSSKAPARMRAIAAGNGRVRFSAAVVAAIAGAATRSGSMTTIAGGPAPCDRLSRSVRCGRERRTFRRASASVASPRRGILQLGRLRGADSIWSFRSACLEEPSDIRAIRTDLPLATGPLDSRDVFDPNVPRWFVTGDTEQVTTLEGDIDGRVTERVSWTLNFSRLAR
jgi:hypothetical protein